MAEAKLVFLSFETKYLTPKIGSYIKLKLLKSYISYKKFKTWDKKEMPKKYENNRNFEKYGKFPSKFKVFVFHLKPQNFYTKYNFLIAIKLASIFAPGLSFQFTYSSMAQISKKNRRLMIFILSVVS